jgi:hypothetical protein
MIRVVAENIEMDPTDIVTDNINGDFEVVEQSNCNFD